MLTELPNSTASKVRCVSLIEHVLMPDSDTTCVVGWLVVRMWPVKCPPICSCINCDLCSASTQSRGLDSIASSARDVQVCEYTTATTGQDSTQWLAVAMRLSASISPPLCLSTFQRNEIFAKIKACCLGSVPVVANNGSMLLGMCKYVSTPWQGLHTTACSGTR